MSGSLFMQSPATSGSTGVLNGEITPYLEELASRIRDTSAVDDLDTSLSWNVLDRVIAFAASAEQHIAEQQMRIRELESMSTTDELTGLANRRGLKNHMQKVLSSACRYGDTGIVGFLDLDHFKDVNDTHGHDAGDKILCELASLLQTNLRDTDFVARLGGDEFVFVLEKADTTQGLKRAAKIRDLICEKTVKLKRETVRLSASLGLAIYDENSTYEGLMKSADKAMYADKKFRR
ncbi:GGDEF domain-containing protein [Sneathiella glossodoripedis]|uniref:GGDEF domain-containing protein n=1 Tax=Sneathiella glossodoripedis TaxID=418853 RepID=UPI000684D0F5|nr:GGDEF domain-containing protein [Sneathiella glossodoripedis]